MTKKLYCYVDETGQDTEGRFFLVAVVLKEADGIEELEKQLLNIEEKSGKRIKKWGKVAYETKMTYLKLLSDIKLLKKSIFYSIYKDSLEYNPLISLSVAKAIFAKGEDDYSVKIIIDGLKPKEMEKMRIVLKKLKVRYEKIKGMKDEQSVFLRLADGIAGFLRDNFEKQKYTKDIFRRFEEQKIIVEA